MWDVCIEILNDLSQAPGDDITTLNGKCSFPLAAAGVTVDQPWSRARGVLLQIPGRTFCFCGTNGVGMSAYWWWPWRLRGDSVSSLRALCAWTREYVVINFFFKLLLFFYFFKFNQNNPNMSPENGRTLSSGETKQTCCCWRVALEALQLWNVQNPDASWKNQRWGSTISHTTMILHDLFIIFGPETWSREPLGCGRDRVRSLQLLPL